jgi:mannose/cellobiose epimerase-like protein (N-acyl-D-glucosamine 2-epimerase family)
VTEHEPLACAANRVEPARDRNCNTARREAGRRALDFLRQRFAQDDGTVISSVNQDGSVLDTKFDLYNQAFALLAYASGHGALDPSGDWQSRGYALVETLKRDFAHPAADIAKTATAA